MQRRNLSAIWHMLYVMYRERAQSTHIKQKFARSPILESRLAIVFDNKAAPFHPFGVLDLREWIAPLGSAPEFFLQAFNVFFVVFFVSHSRKYTGAQQPFQIVHI